VQVHGESAYTERFHYPWPSGVYGSAANGDGCRIYLRDDWPMWDQDMGNMTVTHELGHAVFSLDHSTDSTNVMYPSGNLPTSVLYDHPTVIADPVIAPIVEQTKKKKSRKRPRLHVKVKQGKLRRSRHDHHQ
jgi:hypothetical protein